MNVADEQVENDTAAAAASRDKRPPRPRRRPQVIVQLEEFLSLEVPHPYGVLPGGNRFFDAAPAAPTNENSTSTTVSPTDLLDDECWNAVLSFCNGIDLARIGQTCRYLYVASHAPELWRDLVLHKLHVSENKVLEHFYHSWKDTYIRLYLRMDCQPTDALHKLEDVVHHAHVPMHVSGIYSDYLYRLHTCRSFAIPEAWLLTCNASRQDSHDSNHHDNDGLVPRVPASAMTTQRFQDDFEHANYPVVVAGGAADWKATQQWHQLSYLLQMATITTGNSNGSNSAAATTSGEQQEHANYHGQMTFRATSGTAALPATFTLPAYLDYCETSETHLMEEAPLYLFDRSSLIQPPPADTSSSDSAKPPPHYACFDDFRPCLAGTCPYWDAEQTPNHDLFRLLGEGKRPDHTWLIMGARRSGSVFHIDPNATHAWNATIVGRKRWIFYPPSTNNTNDGQSYLPPPGVHPSPDGDSVALPLSVGEWLQQFWPEHCRRMKQSSKQQQQNGGSSRQLLRPLECTTGPGDIVFVPHGWWHMVINLDEINIAITHNYVSGGRGGGVASSNNKDTTAATIDAASNNKNTNSNLPSVLRFLRDKRDQVSGCRDRPNEAIQPDCLYEEFVAALKRHDPAMLQSALNAVQEQVEQQQKAQQDKSRGDNVFDTVRRHQERKKRQRDTTNDQAAEGESALPAASKKKSSAAIEKNGNHKDSSSSSIMAKGKSSQKNENESFSFSFF